MSMRLLSSNIRNDDVGKRSQFMSKAEKSRTRRISLDFGENEKDPAEFRDCAALADKLGFKVGWLGDHFMPWSHSGGQSAYIWSLLGACLERTKTLKIGPFVTTPIGARYHPAIIAQASATLDNMYPGRFLLGVGTGEAMNEIPFLGVWPSWKERMDRLIEAIAIMRLLWKSSSYVNFDGEYFKMRQVYLYTKPKTNLKIYFSSTGPKAAYYAGKYGDHLITLTLHKTLEQCRDEIFPSFERGARDAGKNPRKMEKIVSLNFTLEDEKSYLKEVKKTAGILAKASWNEPDPRRIEAMGYDVSDEVLLKSTRFCSSWDEVLDLISKCHEVGASEVCLFSGPHQKVIRTYAKKVLPHFKD